MRVMKKSGSFLLSCLLGGVLVSPIVSAQECDLDKGKQLFQVCSACHSITKDVDPNKQGPTLKGLLGREVGALVSFEYSPAMLEAKFIWSPEKLNSFIENPNAVIPWNGMPFSGIKSKAERDAVGCYIKNTNQ